MVGVLALLAGVVAVGLGSVLLRTWLKHGGSSGDSHIKRLQIAGHATVGSVGVVLVAIYVFTHGAPQLGWSAVAILIVAGIIGATMFLPWWRRGRRGEYGDNDPAGFYPAEDHFPMRTVVAHGAVADLAWILMIVALLLMI